jgi:hypothetical protein
MMIVSLAIPVATLYCAWVPTQHLSCFKATCASVAIAVPDDPAALVLLGTTGDVENVFVPAIVWEVVIFTSSIQVTDAHVLGA